MNYSQSPLNLYYLLQLAEALLDKETLDYDEVVNLIGPSPFDPAQPREVNEEHKQ